ncbi:MAG: hypothetical protein QOK37_868 [Thermoanaerobaculia bacterium]|nr:hypothetical protein [Thermoanaerobaculia bacterium]
MNREDEKLCQLPKRRSGRRVELLASLPTCLIAAVGLALYVTLVALTSGLEWSLGLSGHHSVKASNGSVPGWWDILYFNFVSILTIGYGDYSPNGIGGRLVTVLEALGGTGVLGLTLAAVTAKFLSPPQNAIVFSRNAYYCTDDERFLVIYLNTSRSRLVNAEISSYFKLGGDWRVRPSVRSPFVSRAVQTFFTDEVSERDLVTLLNEATDAFRFGISGQLGGASLSVAIEYRPEDIVVIPNRETLTAYPGFWNVDLRSDEFVSMFHYRPADSRSLIEYVATERQR